MTKDIYFQNEDWGEVAIQHDSQVHHFSNVMCLIAFLQSLYGQEFNLIEVNDENYHQLQQSGAFDDQ